MRIKSINGSNMADAMNKVRQELGDDAIILSTQDLPSGETQITAAIERSDPEPPAFVPKKANGWASNWDSDWKNEAEQPHEKRKKIQKRVVKKAAVNSEPMAPAAPAAPTEPAEDKTFLRQKAKAKSPAEKPIKVTPQVETLVQAMAYHGIPTLLAERICRSALSAETEDTTLALAASLDTHFDFAPKFSARKKPLMLVGPPGVGKTMTIAKMAASATMDGRPVHVVTTDKSRAGAVDQLKAFTDILKLKLWVSNGAENLPEILAKPELNDGAHVLIDTGGINCYETSELEALAEQIVIGEAEIMVVLPAGSDSAEMSDTAEKFAAIGANRMLVTRLDTTRRYGGVLTAADKAKLSFSYACVSPSVASGLHVLTPVNLARLILRDPTQQGVSSEFDKVQK
jgi:flagellar biosynthesis protein FlhF